MNRTIPMLRSRARMLDLEDFSDAQTALRLQVTSRQAQYLVTRASKVGPLPLKTVVRRAA